MGSNQRPHYVKVKLLALGWHIALTLPASSDCVLTGWAMPPPHGAVAKARCLLQTGSSVPKQPNSDVLNGDQAAALGSENHNDDGPVSTDVGKVH